MRKSRKFVSFLAGLSMLAILVAPGTVLAVDVLKPACDTASGSTLCKSNTNQSSEGNSIYGPNGVLTRVARLFAVLVGIASVIMIIIGGFKFVTSSGDPGNVKSAKDTVLFAIVGLLVALMAQSIVIFVLQKL